MGQFDEHLVLCATGCVGEQLVPRLIGRGYGVRCLVRDQSSEGSLRSIEYEKDMDDP